MKSNHDTNSKRILLVDDEAMVRKTCQRMLTRMGYDVMDAPNGREAVALYREHWQSISVVLLDMFMPEMNGCATLAELRQVNPDARVILSSGYPEDETIDSLTRNTQTVAYMKKPFGLQELLDTMHRVSVLA